MKNNFYVTLKEIVDDLNLSVLCCSERLEKIKVRTPDMNRPGLALSGYVHDFSADRIQLLGNVEMNYLRDLSMQTRKRKLETLFSFKFPCLILCRGLKPFPGMLDIAKRHGVPILSSNGVTTEMYSNINRYLMVRLAPRESIHGCLIEVYGEGVLIMGNSGVGKSETALELVKRGHRLVADDIVEVRKVSDSTLVGSAPPVIRHLIEIRGIGFLDVRHLFGIGAVKLTENIELIINLEHWIEGKEYERVGVEDQFTEILGNKVPSVTIPVIAGRNLAIIVESAAMNNRQKKMGYNSALELNRRVFEQAENKSDPDWDRSIEFFK